MKNAGSTKPLLAATLLMGLSFALWISPASAQRGDDQGMQNAQNACQGDAQKLCGEFIPDRAKIASCLFKKKRELTPACRTVVFGSKATASGKGKRHGKRGRHR
jgi:hypothetical protein